MDKPTLIRIYKLSEQDLKALHNEAWCHWGLNDKGQSVGHIVSPETEWATIKINNKQDSHGCVPCMKRLYPDVFTVSTAGELPVTTKQTQCPECNEELPANLESRQGFKCQSCDHIEDAEGFDQYTLRECSNDNCGQIFVATDGNNCPQCNRPFTRRLADIGCNECEEGEMETVTIQECPSCSNVFEVSA